MAGFGSNSSVQQSQSSTAAQAAAGSSTDSADGSSLLLPWSQTNSNINSVFFPSIAIKGSRWDDLFPYRLMVIDANNNQIVRGNSGALNPPTVTVTTGTSTSIFAFESLANAWVFNLPITPQQLNITDQFAINTSATLRGVLEEHSGVRFKQIVASGSMGVWPYRASLTASPTSPNILQSLFSGTISAATNLASQFTKTINTITTGHQGSKPTSIRPEISDNGITSTGYYQAIALQQFLEQYAEAKLDPNNASWRLVFDIPKQNQSFVVTPVVYNWQQSAQKPMEIMFNFQLKAWRRIKLNTQAVSLPPPNLSVTPGVLQTVLNSIQAARLTASSAINLIASVRSDVETPLTVLNQTALFVKQLAGAVITAADLPYQIQTDYASSIALALGTFQTAAQTTLTNPTDRANLLALEASAARREGLSMDAVSSGQLGTAAANDQLVDPANNVFKSPQNNFNIFNQVPINSLSLTDAQLNRIQEVLLTASQTTIAQLKEYRQTILGLALQLSNSFGAGDSYYSKVYNRPAPTPRIQPMTLDEYDILESFYNAVQSYDLLTATTQIDDASIQTNMEYVAGLASQSNIPFTVTQSKIMVPVPFGLTVEGISQRYLGDPQRWLEIVTLNNLQEPYIDENGFQLPLLSNAIGRQVIVGSNTNLYLGQTVTLMGTNQLPMSRTILGIEQLSSTAFLITLDGLPNLDSFVVSNNSYLQVYLPGTVNSQQRIFVPSTLPSPTLPNDLTIIPPSATLSDPLTGLSKVDWLLSDNGDLAINNYGDFRLSYGLTNIIQALRIKIGSVRGNWLVHPEFGLGLNVGTSVSLVNIQDIFNSMNTLISQDPRFQGLASLQITQSGPELTINLGVTIAGQTGVFPINFQLPTSGTG